jgi:hypothetical protein
MAMARIVAARSVVLVCPAVLVGSAVAARTAATDRPSGSTRAARSICRPAPRRAPAPPERRERLLDALHGPCRLGARSVVAHHPRVHVT